MKNHNLKALALCLFTGIVLMGCGSSEDGPSMSDNELLNRGKAGRDAGVQGSKTAPATPGAATTGQ